MTDKEIKKQVKIERENRDKITTPFTREMISIIGQYDGSLSYDIKLEDETKKYVEAILGLVSTKEMSVIDFKVCITKATTIVNYILEGLTKSIGIVEDSFIRKVFGKNVSEMQIKELHNTLLGNINYEKKSKLHTK